MNNKSQIHDKSIISTNKISCTSVLLAALIIGTMPAYAQQGITPTRGSDSLFEFSETDTSGENTFNFYSYENGELTEKTYNVTTKANYNTGRYGAILDGKYVDSIDGWFMNHNYYDYDYDDRATWSIIFNKRNLKYNK